MKWETLEFELKATSKKTTLGFVSTVDGGWGPIIDNVVVTEMDDAPTTAPTTTRASK